MAFLAGSVEVISLLANSMIALMFSKLQETKSGGGFLVSHRNGNRNKVPGWSATLNGPFQGFYAIDGIEEF